MKRKNKKNTVPCSYVQKCDDNQSLEWKELRINDKERKKIQTMIV